MHHLQSIACLTTGLEGEESMNACKLKIKFKSARNSSRGCISFPVHLSAYQAGWHADLQDWNLVVES